MYCKNLSKKINGNLRCKLFKHQITLGQCKKCLNFQPRANKSIKKVSDKREFVLDSTYCFVKARDKNKCRLIGNKNIKEANNLKCEGWLELHHIVYRSEDKSKINDVDNCIMLCTKHHNLVHRNKHYWQPILKQMIGDEKDE
jgi:hypothetical protein